MQVAAVRGASSRSSLLSGRSGKTIGIMKESQRSDELVSRQHLDLRNEALSVIVSKTAAEGTKKRENL